MNNKKPARDGLIPGREALDQDSLAYGKRPRPETEREEDARKCTPVPREQRVLARRLLVPCGVGLMRHTNTRFHASTCFPLRVPCFSLSSAPSLSPRASAPRQTPRRLTRRGTGREEGGEEAEDRKPLLRPRRREGEAEEEGRDPEEGRRRRRVEHVPVQEHVTGARARARGKEGSRGVTVKPETAWGGRGGQGCRVE
eukprot:891170-Rhodomonas_salina.1